jgi:hypothetical protein
MDEAGGRRVVVEVDQTVLFHAITDGQRVMASLEERWDGKENRWPTKDERQADVRR